MSSREWQCIICRRYNAKGIKWCPCMTSGQNTVSDLIDSVIYKVYVTDNN